MAGSNGRARPAPRSWGYWTEAKLGILEKYLERFLTASQRMSEVVYLDAFAGDGEGISRATGQAFSGSARIALDACGHNGNRFTRLRYFERDSKAGQLESRLKESYPGRDIKVYPGDCNEQMRYALEELRHLRWAPTFAFVDPDGMEVAWSTLRLLADHKRQSPNKVEIWLLFSTPGIVRVLGLAEPFDQAGEEKITRLFGSDEWRPIHEARRGNQLSPEEARDEFLNLMRWRLENELGYKWTHPIELKTEDGRPVYHMVFATDNDAGNRIMTSIYQNAARDIPRMAHEVRERKPLAQLSLGFFNDVSDISYVYERPKPPYGSQERDAHTGEPA